MERSRPVVSIPYSIIVCEMTADYQATSVRWYSGNTMMAMHDGCRFMQASVIKYHSVVDA